MRTYRPSFPYSTVIELFSPTIVDKGKGVRVKEYPQEAIRLNCSFQTYGGTETTVNDLYILEDTAYVETWYRPDIKADCRIKLVKTGQMYEILNTPENIDMRNQFCKFKVRAIRGGA